MKTKQSNVPAEQIEKAILLIRGRRVILAPELASLYKEEE
jgi:hypothetical protein